MTGFRIIKLVISSEKLNFTNGKSSLRKFSITQSRAANSERHSSIAQLGPGSQSIEKGCRLAGGADLPL